MNRQRFILAFDFGSTGTVTVALYDRHQNNIAAFGHGHYTDRPGLTPGYVEQDPNDWIAAAIRGVQNLRGNFSFDGSDVAGIGIGGHMHAATFLGSDNRPLQQAGALVQPSILWNDSRGQTEALCLRVLFNEPIAARLTASRVLWFKEQHPTAWENVAKVSVPSATIGLWLTGEFTVGPGDASGMFGQLDATGQFDARKLTLLDPRLPSMVPRVVAAGAVAGRLCAATAIILGLPEGIPVACPEGDQPIGMIASGAVRTGQATISLGNSAVFNVVGNSPILNKPGVVDPFRTSDLMHLLMTCATSGTAPFDRLVDLYREANLGTVYAARAALTALAAGIPAGAGGVMSLPFFHGEGVFQQPAATAAFLGFRQGKNKLCFGTMTRAVLEGSTLVMLAGLHEMGLRKLDEVVVSGGGSQNDVWLQILASAFGARVRRPLHADEAGSLGAAYLAETMVRKLEGDGAATLDTVTQELVRLDAGVEPIEADTRTYAEMLPVFCQAMQQLRPLQDLPFFQL